MNRIVEFARRRRRDEGATAVEYALLIALVAIVLSVGAFTLGSALSTNLEQAGECVGQSFSDCGGGFDDGGDGDDDDGGDDDGGDGGVEP